MRKGSLSIEIVIILVLGVLVVAAVVGFLLGAFKPAAGGTSLDVAKTLACNQLKSMGCTGVALGQIRINNFDADKDGKFDPGSACYWDGGNAGDCAPPFLWSWANPSLPHETQDNLFTLCMLYYGCAPSVNWPHWEAYTSGRISTGDVGHSYSTEIKSFNECCRKQVCGCEGSATVD
jgi:hypothetical protein